MCLDVDQDKLIEMIGHDGSEIIWPEFDEPFKRRAFHPQELIDCAIQLSYWVMPIEHNPIAQTHDKFSYPFERHNINDRFNKYLHTFNNCVIVGRMHSSGMPHAVAWDGLQLIDPKVGEILSFKNLKAEIIFVVGKNCDN